MSELKSLSNTLMLSKNDNHHHDDNCNRLFLYDCKFTV